MLDASQAKWDTIKLTSDDIRNRIVAFNSVNTSKQTYAFNFCFYLSAHLLHENFVSLGWPADKISQWTVLNTWKTELKKDRSFVLGTDMVKFESFLQSCRL